MGAALLSAASGAFALDVRPYSPQALAALQKADKPVALHFRADWCPTCRAQDQAIAALKKERGPDLTLLTVNYDTDKAVKQAYGVQVQSTLVVLHGTRETGRLAGEIDAAKIRAVLKTGL
jgi:thiol-disulfide isomerase/thioredoxin